jgi:3-hydroxy-9,10-secoandrosta-1,3,5(10)-triene-9,17-dione monooxygenase
MAEAGRKPNAGLSAGPDPDDRAYAAMIACAKALVPRLRERASRTEELRRLPPETERELHEAGLFRIVQPKRVGGSEFDYVALVDCADAIGQADASAAWPISPATTGCWPCSTAALRIWSGARTPTR